MRHVLQIVASVLALLTLVARAQAEPVPPVAKSIKADETAILLVDFQANFVSPDGAWYGKFAEHYKKTRMLDRIVELVRKARAKGVLVVHITEGYTSDYRELDASNPGMFHRGQIGRGAWKARRGGMEEWNETGLAVQAQVARHLSSHHSST